MVMQRDLLNASPATPVAGSNAELAALMAEQADYLADIALGIRKLNPDVLCSAVVKGTSQVTNAITDLNCHEVMFELGGKPVEVYKIFAFNTYANTMYMNVLSMSSIKDGIPIATGGSLEFGIPVNSFYLMLSALTAGSCPVNGPTTSDVGGIFIYGFTIPDYDRVRGSRRS